MERQAEGQHIPLAAWARARLIASLEAIERDEDATRAADDVRRKQEETLGKTQELLDRTIRLYQSAVEKRGPDESGGGDDGSV